MVKLKNSIKHFKKICVHKYWVGYYCFKFGLYKQGILHDLSKFSPTEFLESVNYYVGTYSPIDACKKDKGYSMAWFHHRGRNKHHWEYWVDDFEKGTIPKKMPYKYMLEMFCDWLGAGKAYNQGKDTDFVKSEYEWWLNKRKVAIIHTDIFNCLDYLFDLFKRYNGNIDKITKYDMIVLNRIYEGEIIYEIKTNY